jgi:hypothetical protein
MGLMKPHHPAHGGSDCAAPAAPRPVDAAAGEAHHQAHHRPRDPIAGSGVVSIVSDDQFNRRAALQCVEVHTCALGCLHELIDQARWSFTGGSQADSGFQRLKADADVGIVRSFV